MQNNLSVILGKFKFHSKLSHRKNKFRDSLESLRHFFINGKIKDIVKSMSDTEIKLEFRDFLTSLNLNICNDSFFL